MARNLKPKWKQSRREGYSLFDSDKWQKRPSMPGSSMGGQRRRRSSNYALQFREKQKVKRMYGMLERQFRRFFEVAAKKRENTGTAFLQLLEMRLDNVVYRLGIAKTRAAARQLVTHGHVAVNGNRLDIPSHIVQIGDSITVKDKIVKSTHTKVLLEDIKERVTPKWLKKGKMSGEVVALPARDMIDPGINERLIVELYSK